MTQAILGFDVAFQTEDVPGDSPITWTTLAEVITLSLPSLERDSIDASNEQAPWEWREYIMGLSDGGEIDVEMNFIPSSYTELQSELDDQLTRRRRILFNGLVSYEFSGFLIGLETPIPLDDRVVSTARFKVTGEPGPLETI